MYGYLLEIPQWYTLFSLFTAYVVYYLTLVVKRPMLACAEGSFKEFLEQKVTSLEIKFWPTFWCVESRAQTVMASLLRSQLYAKISYRRDILTLKDGGEVALDWLEQDCAEDAPCVIILPGLTGESQAEYVKCLVVAANEVGIRVVVFNNRGLGGIGLKTPRMYCASNCEDLAEVVLHVRRTLPCTAKLGATGISMGGLILGNYLARHPTEAQAALAAAKIISVPWNIEKGCVSIEKPFINRMLGWHLASSLCRTLERHLEVYTDLHKNGDDIKRIMRAKTIKEFDSLFTAKQFGYAHVDEYYSDATLHNKLERITVPLLCLSAADDPFQPLDGIPIAAAQQSTHVAIIVTARGGHIGFLEGLWPTKRRQYMSRLFVEFFKAALFDVNGEFSVVSRQMQQELTANRPVVA